MWYYVKINGQYVVSPRYGVCTLSSDKKGLFLFQTQDSAKVNTEHLVQSGDDVQILRTYNS